MKIIISLVMSMLLLLNPSNCVIAAEIQTNAEPAPKLKKKVKQTLTIESKVTGSQEQPKVLYIMPWQGITRPITITDKDMELSLPAFQPINPKTFKKEVRDFANNQVRAKK